MARRFLFALVLPVLITTPAMAQLNAGDPCPETTPGRIFTQEGAAGPSLVCNGTTLEVDESIKTGPYRRGVGTANPAAMLDVAGEAKIGNTSLACSGTTEGAMRYNSTSKEMEYCNGTAWTSLSPAAGGGGLKVYKSDGTTVVGNYLGNSSATASSTDLCVDTLYSDVSTGQIQILDTIGCGAGSAGATVIFTATNCTGTPYISTGSWGYCCTGSASCTTNKCRDVAGTSASRSYLSTRSAAGVCTNSGGTVTRYLTTPVFCGDTSCVVK